ncbi:MAG: hypothetical protein ACU0CI_05080 [Shimia sp.]
MSLAQHAAARLLLARQRSMTSLMEQEIAAETSDMEFYAADYVPLYFDLASRVESDCAQMVAYRSATLRGQLLWMVFTQGKAKAYHASCTDPFEAFDRAARALARRKALKAQWHEVEALARDLLRGRQRFDVRVEDLHASPLCALGVEGFRAAFGLSRVTWIPGWLAALLMKIEPQVGFVLHAAAQRHARKDAAAEALPLTA